MKTKENMCAESLTEYMYTIYAVQFNVKTGRNPKVIEQSHLVNPPQMSDHRGLKFNVIRGRLNV